LSLCTIGNRSDELLKAINIEVRIGADNKLETVVSKCDYILTINNDYLLCTCFPTDQNFTYLKIVIKKANENLARFSGKTNDLIKVKSIKLVGKREIPAEPKTTVLDASICWYFEMISSMALLQSQIMPNLISKILHMTK
jgi:hypothetical protein